MLRVSLSVEKRLGASVKMGSGVGPTPILTLFVILRAAKDLLFFAG
jgi:hypothetical protein